MLVTPKLRLVRQLGSGGMGAVWLADHLALHTQVVVKFVSDNLLSSSEAVGRFSREAAAASQVKSPHVVQMLDYGVTESGIPYIVMELLEGHDLAEHLTPRGSPPARGGADHHPACARARPARMSGASFTATSSRATSSSATWVGVSSS